MILYCVIILIEAYYIVSNNFQLNCITIKYNFKMNGNGMKGTTICFRQNIMKRMEKKRVHLNTAFSRLINFIRPTPKKNHTQTLQKHGKQKKYWSEGVIVRWP